MPTPLGREGLRVQPRIAATLATTRANELVDTPLERLPALDALEPRRRHLPRLVVRIRPALIGAEPRSPTPDRIDELGTAALARRPGHDGRHNSRPPTALRAAARTSDHPAGEDCAGNTDRRHNFRRPVVIAELGRVERLQQRATTSTATCCTSAASSRTVSGQALREAGAVAPCGADAKPRRLTRSRRSRPGSTHASVPRRRWRVPNLHEWRRDE